MVSSQPRDQRKASRIEPLNQMATLRPKNWILVGDLPDLSHLIGKCKHRHHYVSIDDGKYLEKCVLCDKPKGIPS